MRIAVPMFVVGLVTVLGLRLLYSDVERAGASVTTSSLSEATHPRDAARDEVVETVAQTVRALSEGEHAPVPAPDRPPDLMPLDELVGHFYGEPTPWDSNDARETAEARFSAAGEALESAGAGEMLRLDCTSYPCLSIVETDADKPLRESLGAVHEHLDGMAAWSFMNVEIDGREVRRVVLQQEIDDISRWDPYLQMRKEELLTDATLPPSMWPSEEEAAIPIVWPEMGR